MNIIQFLKAPERAICDAPSVEWNWSKREAATGTLAAVACVLALTLQASEAVPNDTPKPAPAHQIIEVSG